jgi:hypothetical protein
MSTSTTLKSAPKAAPQLSYFQVLLDPIARNYVVTIIAAVLVLFVVQLFKASMVASIITTLLAVVVLLLQKRSLVLLMVPLVAYLQLYPTGVPTRVSGFETDLRDSHFRIIDLALVGATMVYVFAQLRFFSLASLAVPEGVGGSPTSLADRRSPNLLTENELTQLFMSLAVLVMLGQFLWVIIAEVQVQFSKRPLVTIRDPSLKGPEAPRDPNVGQSRMIVLGLMLGVPTVAGSFLVWLWRWRALTRAEATMYLTDLGWQELRREAARQETWRASALAKPPAVASPTPKSKPKPKPDGQSLEKVVVRWVLLVSLAICMALLVTCGLWMFVLGRG